MKPTATTCIAVSRGTPSRLHASGINSRLPEGTPEAPQAASEAITQSNKACGRATAMPRVCAAARDKVLMVMAAPAILTVAPTGMVTA